MRETTNVIGIAATAAISGVYVLLRCGTSTSRWTPHVVTVRFAALVSGNSRNFRQVGLVR